MAITFRVSRRRREMYCGHARLCVCPRPHAHYCTDPDVTWGSGRGCPLVVHYWTDLQLVHGLRCCGNITRTWNVREYMLVLALCLVIISILDIWNFSVYWVPWILTSLAHYRQIVVILTRNQQCADPAVHQATLVQPQWCSVRCSIVLGCMALHCIAPLCFVLWCIVLYCSELSDLYCHAYPSVISIVIAENAVWYVY